MVTDGGQDFGIDALAFGSGSPRIWLIQTKWSDGGAAKFGENDVLTLEDGLRRIDSRKLDRFNDRTQKHVAQLLNVLDDPHAQITITIALMRKDAVHKNVMIRLDEMLADFNQLGNYVDYELLYMEEIWDIVHRSGQPSPIEIHTSLEKWFDINAPMRAINGTVEASRVAAWYEEFGDRLFRKNIRESLGVTQVNAEIQRSLIDEPESFWYRNNGITMLCNSFSASPISKSRPYHNPVSVTISGASVINGAQTVAAIHAAVKADEETAGSGIVGIRIIESSESASSNDITKSTNTQNHIERRDFVALDPIQIALREEFRVSLGLLYSIRRSEFEPSPDSGCTIREAAVALACAHPDPGLTARVRNNENLLWEDDAEGAYSRLFKDPPSALQIWRSVQLLRAVRNSLNRLLPGLEGRAEAVAEQASLTVAHLVFQRIDHDGIDNEEFDWTAALTQAATVTDETLRWLIISIDERFGTKSFITGMFSSDERVRALASQVLGQMEGSGSAPELPSEYRPAKRQRAPRSRNAVPVIVDAAAISDGTRLDYNSTTEPERIALENWLAEDPRRGVATWVNERSKPLVWSSDGKRYSPTGLVMRMYKMADWKNAPVAVQGTIKWSVSEQGTLADIAGSLLRQATDDAEEDAS